MPKCNLCGRDIPDGPGIGGTLMVVHGHDHEFERTFLKMEVYEYAEWVKRNPHDPIEGVAIKSIDPKIILKMMFEEHNDFCLDQHNQVQGHNPMDCFFDWVREKIEE